MQILLKKCQCLLSYNSQYLSLNIRIGNSMICSDIWYKNQEWYFKIVLHNLGQFWNITSGIYAKYYVQYMLLLFYTTTWEIQSSNTVCLFSSSFEQIGFEVLVFGPAGPDIDPGWCTFLSILVFPIFFLFLNLLISKSRLNLSAIFV